MAALSPRRGPRPIPDIVRELKEATGVDASKIAEAANAVCEELGVDSFGTLKEKVHRAAAELDIPINYESMGGGSDVDGPPLPAAVVVATPVGNDGGNGGANGAAAEQEANFARELPDLNKLVIKGNFKKRPAKAQFYHSWNSRSFEMQFSGIKYGGPLRFGGKVKGTMPFDSNVANVSLRDSTTAVVTFLLGAAKTESTALKFDNERECSQFVENAKRLIDEHKTTLAQLRADGHSAQEVGSLMAFHLSDIIAAYNLKKGHQFVCGDPLNEVGQVVFAEGKVGVITGRGIRMAESGNDCKISYSDGSTNRDFYTTMGNGYLRFANYPRRYNPVEPVFAMVPDRTLAQLKDEDGYTAKRLMDDHLYLDYPISDIIAAYNLKEGHQFVMCDRSNKVGQVVFAEGKVGVITKDSADRCKISYSDGSTNRDMTDWGGGYLRFAKFPGDIYPVEPVWAME
jgi:hypothetical protein